MIKVLSLDDAGAAAHDYLRERLDAGVELAVGGDSADFHVLISGSLTDDLLTRSNNLHTVILPWAGVPSAFRDILSRDEYAHIALHNSHYNAQLVAEFAVTMLLAAMKNLVTLDRTLRRGDWRLRYTPSRARSFSDKRVLILGYGKIGRKIARLLTALGFAVHATRRSIDAPTEEAGVTIHPADHLHDLLPETDALICALPLTDETRGLVGSAEIAALPDHAVIVNIGRGASIDEQALYTALRDGKLGAAALDVWYDYPKDKPSRATTHPSKFPFYELDNVIFSPHASSALADEEDLYLRMDDLAQMLNAAARGEAMPNRVDLEAGY